MAEKKGLPLASIYSCCWMAAHLAGVVAAHTTKPTKVIRVEVH